MNIEELENGFVKLTAPHGIVYLPTHAWYSEVVTKAENIHQYAAYEPTEES